MQLSIILLTDSTLLVDNVYVFGYILLYYDWGDRLFCRYVLHVPLRK